MKPLYKKDNKSIVSLSKFQKSSLNKLLQEINNRNLKLIENNCLCGNENKDGDIVLSEKDRYGIPVPSIICSKCGLIRSGVVFDNRSNSLFYEKYYRDVYVGEKFFGKKFFADQVSRGENFFRLIEKKDILNKINNVLEIGCGSGGILYPFFKNGKKCQGFDYDERYLAVGREVGLNLIFGDYFDKIKDNSIDLVILSHVLEHLIDPIEEISKIIQKINPGKYLLVEVPGIFYIDKVYLNPLLYLQNAHVYNYYFDYLKIFFESFNLEVVYGDEGCTFLLKKPENWEITDIKEIYNESLSKYPDKIIKYLIATDNKYKKFKYLSFYYWRNVLSIFLNKIGLKKIIKKVLVKN